jgi:hypothetical protein
LIKDLKQLYIILNKLHGKISTVEKEINALITEKKLLEKQVSTTQKEINAITTNVVITDHAIIRYFERILGYDINDIKNKILPDHAKDSILQLGDCELVINNFKIVVQSSHVVTVIKL